ncbi:MAG: RNA polymerase factor sigma-32 [Deltaproteobacteria bacterium]|nr:RNA polymerase factor sigma-32 [Deltaproteobacteria bacterium]
MPVVEEKKYPREKSSPDEIDVSEEIHSPEEDGSLGKALVPFDTLQRYLAEIRRYPLLSREEEHRVAVQYKEFGDIEAAYKLVTSNLRLVVMIAREYQRAFRNLLDLIQEGNIGLMEAVKNFDPYRGIRFPSYAVWWIRAYIIRYIMNDWRMVKIGTTQAQRKLFFNLQKEKEKLEAEGFTPAPKLLAQRLNVKEGEVVEMEQRLSNRDLSTDVPLGDNDEATLLHFLADHKQTPEERLAEAEYRQILSEKMEEFAGRLKDKELVIFRERLLTEEPLTLREIGERYGISRERVRQIEERVKKKLRDYLGKEFKDIKDTLVGAQ